MNTGTPCCAVYPVVCFDDSHTCTVLLIKLHACVCMSQSLALNYFLYVLNSGVFEMDCMSYNSQGQEIELIFFLWELIFSDIYIIDRYNFRMQPGCIFFLWWNESSSFFHDFSFKICSSSRKYIQNRSLLTPSGNKRKHKPFPPHFSWMPPRSPLYLTQPRPSLNYV